MRSNGYGECKYYIDRNETTPIFDYNARNDIKKMYKWMSQKSSII